MVQQLRVVDLAGTMGITPTELIFKLRSIGVSVGSEEDVLDLATVRSIITGETLNKRPREVIVRTDEGEEEESAAPTARERLVRRRRKVIKTADEIKEVAAPKKPATEEETDEPEVSAEAFPEAAQAMDVPGADDEPVEAAPAEAKAPVEEQAAPELTPEEAAVAAVEAAEAEEAAEEEEAAESQKAAAEPEEAAAAEESEESEAAAEGAGEATDEEAAEPAAAATEEAVEEEIPEGFRKAEPEISEEELLAGRDDEDAEEQVRRVRKRRAHTPLEQGLRELSQDEIKEKVKKQRKVEEQIKKKKTTRGSKKLKAAEAAEIRDLLHKFEEQKVKSQEGGPASAKPDRRRRQPPTGRRKGGKRRKRRQQEERTVQPPRPSETIVFKDEGRPEGPIILTEMVTTKELAEKLNVMVKDLLSLFIQRGMMVTANQPIPHEVAEEVCEALGVEAMVASVEEVMEYEREESEEAAGPLEPRPPVVTVMGHVDHGKTSLLDSIRSSRVADGEAGGITQHIGASRIETDDGRVVVFVDTPGHEAFTHMRARGAQVTDIVILVVAADDGVMPQTIEAINHARAANVPIIVAINKIDKPSANVDRLKQQLAEQNILVEDWGGEIPSVNVSAKTGEGIPDLLEMLLLVSEMKELQATSEGPARGIVLEARKEKGRGSVATVLIEQGTLEVGDYFFCGSSYGRVRALLDDRGDRIESAGPSVPVEIMGFDEVPGAGDLLQVTDDEAHAAEVAEYRQQKAREEQMMANRKVSLDNLFEHIKEGEAKELNVVVKADVQGSVEVLEATLERLSTDKVKISVLHGSVGAITTNDVMLATASDAIVVGFNVRPERTAKELAEHEQVDLRLYTVIYDLTDDIKKAMVGLLEPVFREEEQLGAAEVRDTFKVPKAGLVAGCQVTSGIITRNSKARLLRDNVVVWQGEIGSLRRFKDDVSEVRQGFECGISLQDFNDVKLGDVIEAYRMVEVAPEL